ncbi:hypothetical protein ACOMHN_016537 [Nucella lapillus]
MVGHLSVATVIKFARVIPPETTYNPARFKLFQYFGWTRVATIHQTLNIFSAPVLKPLHQLCLMFRCLATRTPFAFGLSLTGCGGRPGPGRAVMPVPTHTLVGFSMVRQCSPGLPGMVLSHSRVH